MSDDIGPIRVNFRMTPEESERFREIKRRAEENGYADTTKLVKELMGLIPWKALADVDREYLVETQEPPTPRGRPSKPDGLPIRGSPKDPRRRAG